MSLKKKVANRRRLREIRRSISVLNASSLEGALWEALRFRCEPPEWLNRPMDGGHVVMAQFIGWDGPSPKKGDLSGDGYYVDMSDKFNRAAVTLLMVAPPDVISRLVYHLDLSSGLVYGASRFTLASKDEYETFEHSRQGDGWVHHTIRANARLWREACRKAGGDARFSVTDQAYDSDHQVGVVPHGHKMAVRVDGVELYPQWHVVA